MSFISVGFSYDGVRGEDMFGLKLVRESASLIDQFFGRSRDILKDQLKYDNRIIDYGTKDNNLEFTVYLAKENPWTFQERTEVNRWLFKNSFRDFITDDYPLVFKIKPKNAKFSNTGGQQGIIKIDFESNASTAFSPLSSQSFDLSSNTGTTNISITNSSNFSGKFTRYRPEMQFTLSGSTSIMIENLSDGGRTFEMTGLTDGETIYVNHRTGKTIPETAIANVENRRFLELVYGANNLRITGQLSDLTFRMQFPIMV